MKSKSSEGPCRNAGIYKRTVRIHFKPKTKKKKKNLPKTLFFLTSGFICLLNYFIRFELVKKKKKNPKEKM